MAALLQPDGTVTRLDGALSLDQLQQLVGGSIEVVTLKVQEETGDRLVLIIDEEGKLKGKPVNTLATLAYYSELNGTPIEPAASLVDPIVGDAVLAIVQHVGTEEETVL